MTDRGIGFTVGTYVEILTGDNMGDITKVKSHKDVGGTICYVLASDEDFYYGHDQLKPVLSKWLGDSEVEDAIALLKRKGVIKDGQILTTL